MSLQLLTAYGIAYFFMMVCMAVFTKRRYNWWITTGVMAAVCLIMVLLAVLRYSMFWKGHTWRFTVVIAAVISLFGELAVSEYRDSRAVFVAFLAGNYAMVGNMAAKLLISVNVPLAGVIVVEIVCHSFVLFLLVRYLLPSYRGLREGYRREWMLLGLILSMFCMDLYLLYDCLKQPHVTILQSMVPMAYLLTVGLLLILSFHLLSGLRERERNDREQRVLQAGIDILKRQIEEHRRAERRIAEYNHDNRHFIRMIRGMMAERDYQGVEKALAEIQGTVEANTESYCRNRPLNGIVSYYVYMAEERMIRTSVELSGLPDDLGEHSWELAAVMGNLLENAVLLAEQVQPPDGRQLRIHGRKNGGQILFEIRSTYSDMTEIDPIKGVPVTYSDAGHTMGMELVAGVVEQWSGILDCGVDCGWFFVRMLV